MSVRGTENFVYYTDKVLGAGSTGTVYFGRHKRKGDSCAIKIFAVSQGSNTKMQVRENELEFMRKLQHKNIVSLITIEKDSRTSEIAMVLELCTEGSLQKRLSEPEYVNGLPEEDFKEFIVQFADGLHYLRLYGIAHRDIKPGNILCTKTEDGRILYKITDFGSSRELFVHDKSKALYGTEEYLHPDVYRCIFIEKVPYGDEYEVRAELWSIGVTLYQVVCGQLPFQALGGRNNRMKMYEIISRKGANIISGVQKENSQIQYSNTLPQTCVLSMGLQERITPLMRKLMEKDEQSQLKFDDFFPKIEELRSTILITIYCLASSSYVHVYVQPSGSLSDIQKIVERYTKISANSQIYLFNGRRLNDIVKDNEPVAMYPKTCERNPLILLVFSINLESIEFKPPFPPGLPSLSSDRNLASDATWSRDACAAVYRLSHITRSLSSMQMFTRQGRKWLVEVLSIDHNNAKKLFVELKSNYSLVIKNVEIAGTNLDRWIDNVLITMQKELKNRKNAMQQIKDLCENLARIKKNSQEKLNDLKAYVKRTDRLVVHIEEKVRNAEKITRLTSEKAFSDCDAPRCPRKLLTYYEQARDTFEQFSKDKKRSLTYNEDQIHKYQRIKLEETLKLGLSVINQHCLPSISKLNDFFRIWFRDECSGPWNNISHLQVDLKKFHEECLKISNTVGEIKLEAEDEVKSLVNQMNLTLPTTSVPLTSRTQETSGYCTEPGLATDKQMEVYSEPTTVVPTLINSFEKLYASTSQNKELTENLIVDLQETDELVLRNELKRGLANSREIPGQIRDKYEPEILEEDSLSDLTPRQLKQTTEMQIIKTPTDNPNKILEKDLKQDEDDSWDVDNLDDSKVSNSSSLMIPAIELSLMSMIAEGSYSFVYKALHLDFGTVAYKKIPVQSVRRPEESRMIGEVERLVSLKHPNIVQLKGMVFESGNYGLVLEFMEYGNISEYLHTNKVGFTEKIKLLHDVVSGMEYLHGQIPPIIHGDLKIQNVLVSECKAAKICDFGLAAWTQYSQRNSKTQDWLVRVSHVPPEHWINPLRRKDEKFDVYGFAILMWETITERQPYQGDSESIRAWVVNGHRPDMTDVAVVDTSENIQQLMVSCWQQDFRSRPMFTVIAEQLSQLPENQKKNVVTDESSMVAEAVDEHAHSWEKNEKCCTCTRNEIDRFTFKCNGRCHSEDIMTNTKDHFEDSLKKLEQSAFEFERIILETTTRLTWHECSKNWLNQIQLLDVPRKQENYVKDMKQLNILALGETGVEKSTLINNFLALLDEELKRTTENARIQRKIVDNKNEVCVAGQPATWSPNSYMFIHEKNANKWIDTLDIGDECNIEPIFKYLTERNIGNNKNRVWVDGQPATHSPNSYAFVYKKQEKKLIVTLDIEDKCNIEQNQKNFNSILKYLLDLNPNDARMPWTFKESFVHLNNESGKNYVFCFTDTQSMFHKSDDAHRRLVMLLDIQLNEKNVYHMDTNKVFTFLCAMRRGNIFDRNCMKNLSARPHQLKERPYQLEDSRKDNDTLTKKMADKCDNTFATIIIVNGSLCNEDVSDLEDLKLQITSVNEDADSVIFKDNDLGFISEYPEQQETVDTDTFCLVKEQHVLISSNSDNIGAGGFGPMCFLLHPKFRDIAPETSTMLFNSESSLNRFKDKAILQQNLRHSNVVLMYEAAFGSPTCSLFLKENKFACRFNLQHEMMLDIFMGLCFLHKLQPVIIHRHHEKILIGDMYQLIGDMYQSRISDFGFSSNIRPFPSSMNKMVGRLEYEAPEYPSGFSKVQTKRIDFNGFAISAWEIFSRKHSYYHIADWNAPREFEQNAERPKLKELDENYFIRELIQDGWQESTCDRPTFEEIINALSEELSFSCTKFIQIENEIIKIQHKCVNPEKCSLERLNMNGIKTEAQLKDVLDQMKIEKIMSCKDLNKSHVFQFLEPKIQIHVFQMFWQYLIVHSKVIRSTIYTYTPSYCFELPILCGMHCFALLASRVYNLYDPYP